MQNIEDIAIYKLSSEESLNEKSFEILNINPKEEIESGCDNKEKVHLFKLNVKEKMSIMYYTNIIFYDNLNKTLPEGMDIGSKVLIDLSKFEMKLVSRKDFYINVLENEFKNEIKLIQVYEYDLEIRRWCVKRVTPFALLYILKIRLFKKKRNVACKPSIIS